MNYIRQWQNQTMEFDRHIVNDIAGRIIAIAYKSVLGGYAYIAYRKNLSHVSGGHMTIEAAIDACNKALFDEGYEFVSEERAEKLRLLL